MSSFVEQNLRRNYILGIINASFFGFVDALASPSLVLSLFIVQLGASSFTVGLLAAIYTGGWFVPQFLTAHRLQQLPVKKPVYVWAAVVRICCWALIVIATYVLGASQPVLLLWIFMVLVTIYSFAAGFAGNAFMTMVAKVIPMHQRGSFFGVREFAGTAMGLLAGYLIAVALSPSRGFTFPDNFAILFVIIFGSVALGLLIWALVREPRETITGDGMTFVQQLGLARVIVRENHPYRRYLLTRFVLAAGDLATPFYAIYATRQLGAPESIVGLYVALTTITALICNAPLSWLSDHKHLASVLALAAGATSLVPLLALACGFIPAGNGVAFAFGIVFVVYGLARTASNIAFPTYLLNIAPPHERTLYIGLTNTVLGIATFIPIVGGVLLDAFGFTPLFIITFIMSAIGLWLAVGLIPRRENARAETA